MKVKLLVTCSLACLCAAAATAAPAAPDAASGKEKVCTAGVGKPFVMPLFLNGRAVASEEVGNGGFFGRSEVLPAAAEVFGSASCCAETAVAAAAAGGCGEKSAACCAEKVAKAAACCAEKAVKTAKADCCSESGNPDSTCGPALTVKACEIGNREFFKGLVCAVCAGNAESDLD